MKTVVWVMIIQLATYLITLLTKGFGVESRIDQSTLLIMGVLFLLFLENNDKEKK